MSGTGVSVHESFYNYMISANPDEWVFRVITKHHESAVYAEKKGVWTWIKAHWLHRSQYRLQNIVDNVAHIALSKSTMSVVMHTQDRVIRFEKQGGRIFIPSAFSAKISQFSGEMKNPEMAREFADFISLSIPFWRSDVVKQYLETASESALEKLASRFLLFQQIVSTKDTVFDRNSVFVSKYISARFRPLPGDVIRMASSYDWRCLDQVSDESEKYSIYLSLKIGSPEVKKELLKAVELMIENVQYNKTLFDSQTGAEYRQSHFPSGFSVEVLMKNLEQYRVHLTCKWIDGFSFHTFNVHAILQSPLEQQRQVIQALDQILRDLEYNREIIRSHM